MLGGTSGGIRLLTTCRLLSWFRRDSSTSALAYKALHRRSKQPPLPTLDTPSWSASTAVSSILYETPVVGPAPTQPHVLNCLVQNEPGVLSRVSGILAARGFNIDSLVVCNTEVHDLSRMTIVLRGQEGVIEQARRQLEDLVPVWAVLNYTHMALVRRELLLAKISLLGPEYFQELLAHHERGLDNSLREDKIGYVDKKQQSAKSLDKPSDSPYHPANLPPSEALRQKHDHLQSIIQLAHQFGGKVVDVSSHNCIVELCAKPERITSFMNLIAPFGVLEAARSGMMALPRTPTNAGVHSEQDQKTAEEIVDVTQLPPG